MLVKSVANESRDIRPSLYSIVRRDVMVPFEIDPNGPIEEERGDNEEDDDEDDPDEQDVRRTHIQQQTAVALKELRSTQTDAIDLPYTVIAPLVGKVVELQYDQSRLKNDRKELKRNLRECQRYVIVFLLCFILFFPTKHTQFPTTGQVWK